MSDLNQYYKARDNNEIMAKRMVDMYIPNHIESNRQTSSIRYTLQNQDSKGYYIQFALRYLEPMLFSSGYWANIKYYTKRGKITEEVVMTTMTPQERIEQEIDAPNERSIAPITPAEVYDLMKRKKSDGPITLAEFRAN